MVSEVHCYMLLPESGNGGFQNLPSVLSEMYSSHFTAQWLLMNHYYYYFCYLLNICTIPSMLHCAYNIQPVLSFLDVLPFVLALNVIV
jgi:hypothetical protein